MNFHRVESHGPAAKAVECYWTVKDSDATPVKQKVIPDGFTEIIFHFGDHYRINLDGRWRNQGPQLLAGQISKFFYLENSGVSDIFGIKLKPAALTHLFGISMKDKADKVVPLDIAIDVENVNEYFSQLCQQYPVDHPIDRALEIIFSKKGMTDVASVCKELSISDRYLQQLFQKYVGLSPKFFARIIRFSYIFQLIKDEDPNWADVVYEAGYYDQSHFIRNFKAFTGEDPSEYIFSKTNLANFFMKKGSSGLYNGG